MVIGSKQGFLNSAMARQGENVTRQRITSEVDSHGTQISESTSEEIVKVVFSQISKKDLKDSSMGQAVVGRLKIYYAYDVDIIEGDMLIDLRGKKWRVENLEKEYLDVYKVAIVQNFGLDGS